MSILKRVVALLMCILLWSCNKESVNTVVVKPPVFKKILILGNSITQHNPAPDIGWNGSWGMAASAQDKDFVHILEQRFQMKEASAKVTYKNVGDFERAYWNYDHNKFNDLINLDPDLVILRVGENVQLDDMALYDFAIAYRQLIEDFRKNGKKPYIICASTYWDQPVDKIILEVAAEKGLPSLQLKSLSADLSNSAYHLFTNQDVGSHPSDKGMLAIADKIWAEVVKLK